MRVLVTGGRDYATKSRSEIRKVIHELNDLHGQNDGRLVLIEGGAPGLDTMAWAWAVIMGRDIETYQADWFALGRSAGPLRNQRMITEGKPDLVVAFPGGRGTADMIRRAEAAGIRVVRIGERG